MARDIEQITPFTALEDSVVRNAGVEALPNSPSSAGIRASELKRRFYQPLEEVRDDIDDRFTKINSNFTEIDEDLTTVEGLAFDKANVEQEVSTSTTKVPSSNLLKTQLDLKVSKAGAENITGIKTFKTGATPLIEDAPSSNTMAANKAYVDTMIPLTAIKTAISGTPLDTNLLSEKFINTTYAKKSDIASVFEYKGTVADYTALSAITGQGVGDTYNMTASYLNTPAGTNWAWNGTIWDALGGDIIISTAMPLSSAAASNDKVLGEKVVYDEFAKKQDLKYGYIVDTRANYLNYWGKVAEIDVSSVPVGDVNLDFLVTVNYYNKNQIGILRLGVRKGVGASIITTNLVDLNWLIKSATLSDSRYVAVIQGLKVSLYARAANQYGGTRFELLQATTSSGFNTSDYYTLYPVSNSTDTDLPTNDGTVTPSVLETTANVIVPTTPSGPSAAVAKSYADSIGFARVYRSLAELGISTSSTAEQISAAMVNNSAALFQVTSTDAIYPSGFGFTGLCEVFIRKAASTTFQGSAKIPNSVSALFVYGVVRDGDTSKKWSGWKQIIDDSSAQTISGVKTYTASPIVPTTPSGPSAAVAKSYADLKVALAGNETISGIKTFATGATPLITDAPTTSLMAVNKAYADGLTGLAMVYDKVISNQTEFNALIGDPSETWLGAKSVALVGQFTLSTANNSGIKIPATVKQIHGFNGAKITVTNFKYDSSTAKGGLWYDIRPTTLDYSIRDLEVDCTGSSARGFYNCTNLTNCTGTGTGTGSSGFGFYNCTNLTNCTGTGDGDTNGYGFYNCTNLTNCTGTGTGTSDGYGFYNITTASNCRGGGVSSTDMWDGTNWNIDVNTCCMTPVAANNTTLNT